MISNSDYLLLLCTSTNMLHIVRKPVFPAPLALASFLQLPVCTALLTATALFHSTAAFVQLLFPPTTSIKWQVTWEMKATCRCEEINGEETEYTLQRSTPPRAPLETEQHKKVPMLQLLNDKLTKQSKAGAKTSPTICTETAKIYNRKCH